MNQTLPNGAGFRTSGWVFFRSYSRRNNSYRDAGNQLQVFQAPAALIHLGPDRRSNMPRSSTCLWLPTSSGYTQLRTLSQFVGKVQSKSVAMVSEGLILSAKTYASYYDLQLLEVFGEMKAMNIQIILMTFTGLQCLMQIFISFIGHFTATRRSKATSWWFFKQTETGILITRGHFSSKNGGPLRWFDDAVRIIPRGRRSV